MSNSVYVAGVGITHFARHLERSLTSLAGEAILAALSDAGIERSELNAAYMGNAVAGLITGQEMIRGEVVLKALGIGGIPVINLENACASSSTAFWQAYQMITHGALDCVLVCGYEKLSHPDKAVSLSAFSSAVDVNDPEGAIKVARALAQEAGEPMPVLDGSRSVFMDIYAMMAKKHMKRYGTTAADFAAVVVKNARHAALNPHAQFTQPLSLEQVLGARQIVDPLTLPMCSPLGDGAAAVVLVSARKALQLGLARPVRVAASALVSAQEFEEDGQSIGSRAAWAAYQQAGIGPQDLSLVELHDASAPSELLAYEYLGLCQSGESAALLASGATCLGGRLPVNSSGGLLRKGHPVGATGCAQIVELSLQLQGRAAARQVPAARWGLAHNAGGALGLDAAVTVVSLLTQEHRL